MKKWELQILAVLVSVGLFFGCASVQKGLQTGMNTLSVLDQFYDGLVEAKAVPEMLKASTIILQQADILATMTKVKDTPEMVAQALVLKAQAESLGAK